MENVIGFVPARGGSKRIPRKNLRTVGGVPLIARTIRTLHAAGIDDVIVSTDDHEIADVAALWGAEVDIRPPELAADNATIDQVVDEWLFRDGRTPGIGEPGYRIVVAQPSSPLLSSTAVAQAVEASLESGHTVFTTFPDRHMLWSDDMRPLNRERVNSTHTVPPSIFRETGALVVFDPHTRTPGSEWPPVPQMMMSLDRAAEAIDVDDYVDLVRARAGAKPALIQFRYAESLAIGSGHRRRCETLAVELAGHHVVTVCEDSKVPVTGGGSVPDVVVLDILDVPASYVQEIRAKGVKHVVTLEDLGPSTPDLRVNELYSAWEAHIDSSIPGVSSTYDAGMRLNDDDIDTRWGPKYAVLRPEFQGHAFTERRPSAGSVRKTNQFTVVVTFGGTDPLGATEHVAAVLGTISAIGKLRVIQPPALDTLVRLQPHLWKRSVGIEADVLQHPCMASEFLHADLVVCSSGRTVHEAVACGVPVIACPVNDREKLHAVCTGVRYLDDVTPGEIASVVQNTLHKYPDATDLARLAYGHVDGLGAQRIAYLIDGLIGGLL